MSQDVIKSRIKALMGRLLSGMENFFCCSLDDVKDNDVFELSGSDVMLIRNLILSACNDTIRALPAKSENVDFTFPRESFPIYKHARLDIYDNGEEARAQVTMQGEARFIYDIREKISRGVVYNKDGKYYYTCVGLDVIIDHVIPFLDQARLARIIIANGDYQEWRESLIRIYTGEE